MNAVTITKPISAAQPNPRVNFAALPSLSTGYESLDVLFELSICWHFPICQTICNNRVGYSRVIYCVATRLCPPLAKGGLRGSLRDSYSEFGPFLMIYNGVLNTAQAKARGSGDFGHRLQ